MKKENDWALKLGIIDVAYFVIAYGIGWIPGMTGWVDASTLTALVLGVNLILYYLLKN